MDSGRLWILFEAKLSSVKMTRLHSTVGNSLRSLSARLRTRRWQKRHKSSSQPTERSPSMPAGRHRIVFRLKLSCCKPALRKTVSGRVSRWQLDKSVMVGSLLIARLRCRCQRQRRDSSDKLRLTLRGGLIVVTIRRQCGLDLVLKSVREPCSRHKIIGSPFSTVSEERQR